MKESQLPSSSVKKNEDEIWKRCWGMMVPPAVKMHIWRACHNLLPTKDNLFRRGVCADQICPLCLRDTETVIHITWECPSANDVWGGSIVKLQKCSTNGGSFRQLFSDVLRRCEKREVELFSVTARKIWMRRNRVVHGGLFQHPNQVLKEAEVGLEDFRRLNVPTSHQEDHAAEADIARWQPPPPNTVKINWDAAVDPYNKSIGLGVIARDERGKFLVAYSKHQWIDVEPVIAEALAALHAIILCQEENFQNVVFEGDSLQVVQAINSDSQCNSKYGHLIEDIKKGTRSLASSIFTHVKRSANEAANALAAMARTHVTDIVRWDFTPHSIGGIVSREELSSPS
ncbi:uncharacterized protein LOC132169261 [Corylus avellana]|uniref:uncharacterized protein LOC132169261 n=1 Tax=Corylus avellana TaxID=13451 RepID=UPI00286BDE9E|nr:uncharacterized protein LOC132169261 [Corylus avellana]